MQVFTKIISLFFVFSITLPLFGQIKSGVILYERKTNLLKKYKTAESQRWLRGEKTKIDRFNLHFTPEKSIFLPDESTIPLKPIGLHPKIQFSKLYHRRKDKCL